VESRSWPRRLKGSGTSPEPFPGEAAWRWRIQLEGERIASPLRLLIAAVTSAAWLLAPQRPSGPLPWVVGLLAWCFVLGDLWVVFRRPELVKSLPWVSGVVDGLFVLAWILVTGGRSSPYLPLLYVGVVSTAFRLPMVGALLAAAAFALLGAWLAPAPLLWGAYLVLVGLGLSLWHSASQNQRRSSLRDSLTGCFTRSYALWHIEELIAQRSYPFSLCLIDLDMFKEVNDGYGHPAGDTVLNEVVRLIEGVIRPGDILARHGGDEFLLVLPQTPEPAALAVAERIRRAVQDHDFVLREVPGRALRQTVSVGVLQASVGQGVSRLLVAVDERLYAAKRVRNRVAASSAAEPATQP